MPTQRHHSSTSSQRHRNSSGWEIRIADEGDDADVADGTSNIDAAYDYVASNDAATYSAATYGSATDGAASQRLMVHSWILYKVLDNVFQKTK